MLSKNKRIPRKMFSLLKSGKTFKNGIFMLRLASKEEKGARFCFSVSKKVAKNAVMRNKMRRLGYKTIEKYIPQINTNKLINISFLSIQTDEKIITKNLEQILKESKIIK